MARSATRLSLECHTLLILEEVYYKHPSFERIRNTTVPVKYEPFESSIAYAYVKGEWVQCRSDYLRELQGRSVKELMIASSELKKLNKIQNKQFNDITGKKLAQFFTRIEIEESMLTPPWREAKKAVQSQHLRDRELKEVLLQIDSDSSPEPSFGDDFEPLSPVENLDYSANIPPVLPSSQSQLLVIQDEEDEDELGELFEPLEEW